MFRVAVCLFIVFLFIDPADSMARRANLSSEQISQLADIRTILLTSSVLTEKGPVQSEALNSLVAERFQKLGYSVVLDSTAPHDVEFRILCEERKRLTSLMHADRNAELDELPDRLWQGPACRFRYRLNGADLGWTTEVRTPASDETPEIHESEEEFKHSAVFALLLQEVAESNFPLLVMADWGHASRLASLLLDPETQPEQQQLIVQQLADFSTNTFLPVLLTFLQQPHFPAEAVEALASAGEDGLPHLVTLFQDRKQTPSVRAAAASGMGRVYGAMGNRAAFELMVDYLAEAVHTIASPDDIEFPVLTAVVWSLSNSRSDQVLRLLHLLQGKIWIYYDPSEDMQELREAVDAVSRFLDHKQL